MFRHTGWALGAWATVLCLISPAAALTVSVQNTETHEDPDIIRMKNVLITESGKGDVFVREMTWPKVMDFESSIQKIWMPDCDGELVPFEAHNVVFTADPDGLPNGIKAETVYAEDMRGEMKIGTSCASVLSLTVSDISVETSDHEGADLREVSYLRASKITDVVMKDVRVFDKDRQSVLEFERFDVRATDDLNDLRVALTNLSLIPETFFYPDILRRLQISEPGRLMTVNADFEKGPEHIKANLVADRILDLSLDANVPGLDTPLTASVSSLEMTFKDKGGFAMFEHVFGTPLPDAIRSGDLPGISEKFKAEAFSSLRDGVAIWVATGEGHVSMRPSAPVAMPAVLATLLLSPARLTNLLNITTSKEKP